MPGNLSSVRSCPQQPAAPPPLHAPPALPPTDFVRFLMTTAIALVLGLVYLGQGTLHEGDVSVSSVQNIMGERQGGRCTWQMGQSLGNTSSTGSC